MLDLSAETAQTPVSAKMLYLLGGGMIHCCLCIWVWVNTYRYIFSGMNIHLPGILGFTRYQGFDPSPYNQLFPMNDIEI